jgi:predicted small integral membrane protein
MIVRFAKVLLTLSVGVFVLLAGIDNIADYGTNLVFVRHVLSMDTTIPESALRWRAITAPSAHHAAYWLIILVEITAGLSCLAGASRLFQARRACAGDFNAAKDLAIGGLAAGFTLFFLGFLVIGGEWFQMWQSANWNAQEAAFRSAASIGLVLIFVSIADEELGPSLR